VNAFLLTAAGLTILGGVLHSLLGERLILSRLATHTLPETLGSTDFTKRILRLMWHGISVAWWGIAGVLIVLAATPDLDVMGVRIAAIIGLTFVASSVLSFVHTRGKHFSWGLFLAIAVTIWLGIR
jgi:hypothetical protein